MNNTDARERYLELLSRLKPMRAESVTRAAPRPEDITDLSELSAAVAEARSRKGRAHAVRQSVGDLIIGVLLNMGKLILGSDGHRFYFFDAEHVLYDVSDHLFEEFLARHSGLIQTEREIFDYVITRMYNRAGELEPTAVGAHSYVDPGTGTAYFANGPSEMFMREGGGEWRTTHNGDGFIFAASHTEPCVPDFTANGAALAALIGLGSIGDGPVLTADEQRILVKTFFVKSQFAYRTRMIASCQGEPGSTKTSFCQNLCMASDGGGFEVVLVSGTASTESVIVSLSNRDQVVLDNLESFNKGFEDTLSVYATGGDLAERRTLYSDNRSYIKHRRTKLLFITSVVPQYTRDDVAERVLPFYFVKPRGGVLPETALRELVLAWRHVVLGDLLSEIGRMADRLAYITPPLLSTRMADFAGFGWVMHARQDENGQWISPEWEQLLDKLKDAQERWSSRDSGMITTIVRYYKEKGEIFDKSLREVYLDCFNRAKFNRLPFPRTPITFNRLLKAKLEVLRKEHNLVAWIKEGHAGEAFITMRDRASYEDEQRARIRIEAQQKRAAEEGAGRLSGEAGRC